MGIFAVLASSPIQGVEKPKKLDSSHEILLNETSSRLLQVFLKGGFNMVQHD